MVWLRRRGKRRQVCLVVWTVLAEFFEQLQVEDSGQLVEQGLQRGDRLSEYQGAERMHRRKLEVIRSTPPHQSAVLGFKPARRRAQVCRMKIGQTFPRLWLDQAPFGNVNIGGVEADSSPVSFDHASVCC